MILDNLEGMGWISTPPSSNIQKPRPIRVNHPSKSSNWLTNSKNFRTNSKNQEKSGPQLWHLNNQWYFSELQRMEDEDLDRGQTIRWRNNWKNVNHLHHKVENTPIKQPIRHLLLSVLSGKQIIFIIFFYFSGNLENVDSMCSEDNRREYTIPQVLQNFFLL